LRELVLNAKVLKTSLGRVKYFQEISNTLGQARRSISKMSVYLKEKCNMIADLDTSLIVATFDQGSYTGCGNTWTVSESQKLVLDPTQSTVYRPWSLRNQPSMTWLADQNEMYTLIAYDAGSLINHGIYFNIPGNDVSRAEVSTHI
jgi:hypothetical protein